MTKLRLEAANTVLNDSDTAAAIKKALPITGRLNRWGDEFYFAIPVEIQEADDAQAEVELGTLAYWPPARPSASFSAPPRPARATSRARQARSTSSDA